MRQVQDFMNSDGLRRKPDGIGLPGLAEELRNRCEALKLKQCKRLPS